MRVLAIVPNSAVIEQLFSKFGIVHNKLCNRLGQEKVRKSILLNVNTVAKFGALCTSQKQKFGNCDTPSSDNGSMSAGLHPCSTATSLEVTDCINTTTKPGMTSAINPFAAGLEVLPKPTAPEDPLDGVEDNMNEWEDVPQTFSSLSHTLFHDSMPETAEEPHHHDGIGESDSPNTPSLCSLHDAFLLNNLFDLPVSTYFGSQSSSLTVLKKHWEQSWWGLLCEEAYHDIANLQCFVAA